MTVDEWEAAGCLRRPKENENGKLQATENGVRTAGLSARLQAFQLTLLSSSITLPTCQLSVSNPSTSEGISGLVGAVVPFLILKPWTS